MSDLYKASHMYEDYILDKPIYRYIVLDLETTIKDKGNPFIPENYICYFGTVEHGLVNIKGSTCGCHSKHMKTVFEGHEHEIVLVGHNIKFDLHWLRRYGIKTHLLAGVWDTMVGHYIISGHANKFPTLEDAAGAKKEPGMKELWDSGVCTSEIDQHVVEKYLKRDLTLTSLAFDKQIRSKRAECIRTQSMATLAIHLIEYNGIKVDTVKLAALEKAANIEITDTLATIHTIGEAQLGADCWRQCNPTAPRTISTLLWGEPGVPYESAKVVGKYKNGKVKTKKQVEIITPAAPLASTPDDVEMNPTLGYPTNEKVLSRTMLATASGISLITAIQKYKRAKKLKSTYIEALWKFPDELIPIIHHTIHQTSTGTGRTSSANPNLQNTPPVIQTVFTSRYPHGGIYTCDFAQLEVCGLAHLSKDFALLMDLRKGIDIHSKVGSSFFGGKMTKKERRQVKGVVFGLIYGGGPKTLSEETGLDIKIVKQVIKKFYENYPGVKKWQEDIAMDILEAAELSGRHIDGYPVHKSSVITETTRMFTFFEGKTPDFVKDYLGFSPMQMKNYFVQGWSTGDIVMMFLGMLRVYMRHVPPGKACVINTVHDDVWIDIADAETRELIELLVVQVIDQLKEIYYNVYGQQIRVPLKVEMKLLN